MSGGRRFLGVAALVLASACASGDFHRNTGVKPSDPQVVGARNMNFDRLIVPGQRVGPVSLGGSVQTAVQHLGKPDRVDRSTFRGPGYNADEVYYYYNADCLRFTWNDSGVDPRIQTGWRGINVTCDKWATPEGFKVGTPIRDIVSRLNLYCPTDQDGELLIMTKQGIWYRAKDRNSAVNRISIVPVANDWGGACKD